MSTFRSIVVLAAYVGLAYPMGASTQAVSCSDPIYGNYELRFTANGEEHNAWLNMNGCRGTMEVRFVASDGRRQRVSQQMVARSSSRGVLIQGSNPLQAETKTPFQTYLPDTLRFQTRGDGTLAIENCWGRGCAPVELLRRHPPVEVRLRNECREQISAAVRYMTIDGVWVRRGWWVIGSNETVRLETWTPYIPPSICMRMLTVRSGTAKEGLIFVTGGLLAMPSQSPIKVD